MSAKIKCDFCKTSCNQPWCSAKPEPFIGKDKIVYVDVDDTLVFEDGKVNHKLIDKLNEWYADTTIVIWSSNCGGVEYIKDIVYKHNIPHHVILPKAYKIIDDDHLEYYSIIDPVTLEYK